jgi:glyoxylase-like metal-dependent hydrolase (beta-lactamase superfamily II)
MGEKVTEILEDLFFIERGYLNANHFVYRGRPPVLIDTGYRASFEETHRIYIHLGIDTSSVHTIFTTHCHCDHIGGNHLIQKLSDCNIILHEIGKIFIDTRDDWSTWWRYYNQEADFFKPTGTLADGDGILVGPHRFEVFHTPGHAADGIVLYHRQNSLLISSDTLWAHDLAVHTVRVEGSTAAYATKKSLERLARLDVKMVYPGHGPFFGDFDGALDRSLKRVAGYLEDRRNIGQDVLKKITVYTLLMKKSVSADRFFDYLMQTIWFKETVDLYFEGAYRQKYDDIIADFLKKKIVILRGGRFTTSVTP